RRRRHDEAGANGASIDSEQAQALDDEDRDETAAASATEVTPVVRSEQPPREPSSATMASNDVDVTSYAIPSVRQPPAAQPVEKPVATTVAAAVSAAMPATTAFNLPTLPPIPDQVMKSVGATNAADEQDIVGITPTAVPPAAPKPLVASANTPQVDAAAAGVESAPAVPAAIASTAVTINGPVFGAEPAVVRPAPVAATPASPAVVAPVTPAPIATPAPASSAAATPVARQEDHPAGVTAPAATVDVSEKPTVAGPIASLLLPKQGDLLVAQPTHPAKPTPPADEEADKPASPLPHDESDAHKNDSHG
ncbi:ribonuclease E/G, partial [Rhodanobacter denitrificans]|nr:ribonuclease E/G [Rhodanobacter denitrificans]